MYTDFKMPFNKNFETVLYNRYIGNSQVSKPINKNVYSYWDFIWYKDTMIRELGDKKLKYINSIPLTMEWYDSYIFKNIRPVVADIIPNLILFKHNLKIIMKFMKKCLIIYKTKILHTNQIIARQKDKDDIICDIRYHPIHDTYFASAFSGRFKGGMENGILVIKCLKEGTTQEAVRLACLYKTKPRLAKSQILDMLSKSATDVENLKNTIGHFMTLADKWFFQNLSDLVTQFIQNYLDDTLYKLHKTTSIQRLQLFIEKSPILAQYIWDTNFSTENARKVLGTALNISQKNMKAFVNSNNIQELQDYIHKKLQIHKSPLDDLPKHLWDEITKCQEDLKMAKNGVRVGLRGRYISSDNIDVANTRLVNAWKKADQWIAKNSKKTSQY